MTPPIEAVLAGINAAVHELADGDGLIDQLALLLPEHGQAPETNSIGRRTPGSRPPWDGQVANTYMAIHSWARHAEADLGTWVRGFYLRRLPGSTAHTKYALRALVLLCEHEKVPEGEVRRVARDLGSLLRAAQSVPGIDLAPAPAATLRQTCPVCSTGALTAAVDGSTEIRCGNDACGSSWAKRQWPFLLSRLAAS